MPPGTLYLVATPIGNLEDITIRALKVLRSAPLVAAEDTRTTRKLFSRYRIRAALLSYHDHSPPSRREEILVRLERGLSVALVSEAGTPGLSDPGYRLVRAALARGFRVVPVPGPAAAVAALTASGLPGDRFVFEGFLPAKAAARARRLGELAAETRTLVFYESPRRLLGALEAMREIMGDRPVVLGRELTKKFEEFIRGDLSLVIGRIREEPVRGEVVVILSGAGETDSAPPRDPAREVEELSARLKISRMEAIKLVARRVGVGKSDLYRQLHRK